MIPAISAVSNKVSEETAEWKWIMTSNKLRHHYLWSCQWIFLTHHWFNEAAMRAMLNLKTLPSYRHNRHRNNIRSLFDLAELSVSHKGSPDNLLKLGPITARRKKSKTKKIIPKWQRESFGPRTQRRPKKTTSNPSAIHKSMFYILPIYFHCTTPSLKPPPDIFSGKEVRVESEVLEERA